MSRLRIRGSPGNTSLPQITHNYIFRIIMQSPGSCVWRRACNPYMKASFLNAPDPGSSPNPADICCSSLPPLYTPLPVCLTKIKATSAEKPPERIPSPEQERSENFTIVFNKSTNNYLNMSIMNK
ncbi:hypothetical protein ILYODFUR_019889 [Ilyodon furcidens]|uniref:Uncharacterized protein n=1 Tax=Ilyodon furcidens TaxID=33524 RepID=A0ABV0TXW4_9TELE